MSPEFRKWLMAEKAKLEKAYGTGAASRSQHANTPIIPTGYGQGRVGRPCPSVQPTDEFSVPVADVVKFLAGRDRYVPVMRCEICDCEIRMHPADTSPRRCQICVEWAK